MTGLEIIRAPGTTAGEIADIIAEHCPPITPEHCDKLACRDCWLAWLTTGEPGQNAGTPDEPTPLVDEAAYELSRAEAALESVVQIIQSAMEGKEQQKLLSDLSTFGRLLEKERNTPTATDLAKVEYIARGLVAGSIHLVATPMEPNMVTAEFIDTIRRRMAARLIFERRFGGYYPKFTELFPL